MNYKQAAKEYRLKLAISEIRANEYKNLMEYYKYLLIKRLKALEKLKEVLI